MSAIARSTIRGRAGRPTLSRTLALARRLLAEDPGRPWRPRRRGLTRAIARSFGRRTAGPPATLALPENAGLSAPDSHPRRHRQGDATDHGARRPSARTRPSRSGSCPGCRAADIAVHFIDNRSRVPQCGSVCGAQSPSQERSRPPIAACLRSAGETIRSHASRWPRVMQFHDVSD